MKMKAVLFAALLAALLLCFGGGCLAEQAQDIVVLYTNDVHCALDEEMDYATLAAMKAEYEALGACVLLVDCGDAVQGEPIGTLSEGEYIIDIMNEVGYDVAAIGNHEFDYGIGRFFELMDMAEFPYVCCNLRHIESGETIAEPYVILERGGVKLAFIGVSTSTMITGDSPEEYMNADGSFIYGFDQNESGEGFYASVQRSIDAARAEGADYIIALCHLGGDEGFFTYPCTDLVANTSGLDVVLDGHSHSMVHCRRMQDRDGSWVLLSQTGTKFESVGMLLIEENGSISTGLIEEFTGRDPLVADYIDGIRGEYDQLLDMVVAHTEVDLTIMDPETGERRVRSGETNMGDLCADAYMYMTGADVAITNGGGVRDSIPAGDITYGDLLKVQPFGNEICVVEATGLDILNALEMGCRAYPMEEGAFLQVAGMSFELDTSVASSVVIDENEMFQGVEGRYRVQNVMIGGEPLDPDRVYSLAGHDHYLKNAGSGMTMFRDNVLLLDSGMQDNQVLIDYIVDYLGGSVGEEYADPYGQGRIIIK